MESKRRKFDTEKPLTECCCLYKAHIAILESIQCPSSGCQDIEPKVASLEIEDFKGIPIYDNSDEEDNEKKDILRRIRLLRHKIYLRKLEKLTGRKFK